MEKRLIGIMTMLPSRHGFAWFPCEIDAPIGLSGDGLVDHCYRLLDQDGMIRLTKLDLEHGSNGEGEIIPANRRRRMVRRRVPTVLTKPMIGFLQPLDDIELIEA